MKIFPSAVLTLSIASIFLPRCFGEDHCCLQSKGKVDSCNPDAYTCWPMSRVYRWASCDRRGGVDCKYQGTDEFPPVRDTCCGGSAECFVPEEEVDFCYNAGAEGPDTRYCTEEFFWQGSAPQQGLQGTLCGGEGFGGLDPHFQVRQERLLHLSSFVYAASCMSTKIFVVAGRDCSLTNTCSLIGRHGAVVGTTVSTTPTEKALFSWQHIATLRLLYVRILYSYRVYIFFYRHGSL